MNELTVDVVRLALSLQQARSQVASTNIANANRTDMGAARVDFSAYESVMRHPGSANVLAEMDARVRQQQPIETRQPISADREIGDMVSASTNYQSLAESLSRYFGLMRLAITGRG